METMVNICLKMKLRDYAAVEDLISELGISVQSVNIHKTERSKPNSIKRNALTKKLICDIKTAKKNKPEGVSKVEMWRELGKPCSESTFYRIWNGERG